MRARTFKRKMMDLPFEDASARVKNPLIENLLAESVENMRLELT